MTKTLIKYSLPINIQYLKIDIPLNEQESYFKQNSLIIFAFMLHNLKVWI